MQALREVQGMGSRSNSGIFSFVMIFLSNMHSGILSVKLLCHLNRGRPMPQRRTNRQSRTESTPDSP